MMIRNIIAALLILAATVPGRAQAESIHDAIKETTKAAFVEINLKAVELGRSAVK
jgi:Pyruvate/2-oxoacid:ferredoxin oxidoreductase gamma subunit